MELYKSNPKGKANVRPEKLYTQQEVDGLMKNRGVGQPTLTNKIEVEKQKADVKSRLDDENVAKMVKKSNRILISIRSVWPFDLYPNVINVEDGRITIIKRHLLSSEVHSVDIKDISNIFINKAFFFSQLEIVSRTFEDNQVRIKYLKNDEAIFIRRIIEGLRIFVSKVIDTSRYSKEELISKLEELSKVEIVN